MRSIIWRPGLRTTFDKDGNDVRRWELSGWVEGATLAGATVTVTRVVGADPAPAADFAAVVESVGADYVDVRITPNGVPPGNEYAVRVAPSITAPGVRLDNFTVVFAVVDQ